MKHYSLYILLFFTFHFSLFTHEVHAQDYYSEALTQFEVGNFEATDSLLRDKVIGLSRQQQVQAYRVLTVSALKQDKQAEAEVYALRLLETDPYYSPYDADPRFTELLDATRMKLKKAKITTASWQEESLEESPVPMTLITERMLRASGARTLADVLLLYVPGMTKVGGIEDNVAMRGVSGMTQETVLVLENGCRLNSYSTNAQPMDYRINLDKVKQIEVLRGPASSLYGSVALTAVVNVITKTAEDVNGCELQAHVGNFGSYGGSFLFGKGNIDSDLFAWFSIYNTKGEAFNHEGAKHYIGGYNSLPVFDLGINVRWGDFKVSVSGKHAKPVPYNNLIGMGNYTYDDYDSFQGEKPGMSRTNLRFDVNYSHKWNDFTFNASVFASYERLQLYNVMSDAAPRNICAVLGAVVGSEASVPDSLGIFQLMRWSDYTLGGTISAAYNYKIPKVGMKGSILAGFQYEGFLPTGGEFGMGCNFDSLKTMNAKNVFSPGSEHTISGFLQLKHFFTNRLILNGGLRYDHRIQFNKENLHKFSPRVSLIWLANKTMTLKGSFSHSFVDAPYLYRASNIQILNGSELKPESMNSFQASANFNWEPIHLSYECNLFYNIVSDLVFFDMSNAAQRLIRQEGIFTNAGHVNLGGIENTLQYNIPRFMASMNITVQHPFKIDGYYASSEHNLANVPKFVGNLVTAWNFFSRPKVGDFWLRANLHTQSAYNNSVLKIEEAIQPVIQLYGIYQMYEKKLITLEQVMQMASRIEAYEMQYERQPFQTILNAGLDWNTPWRLTLGVDAYNITNTRYYVGGITRCAAPQQGFAILGTVRYRF